MLLFFISVVKLVVVLLVWGLIRKIICLLYLGMGGWKYIGDLGFMIGVKKLVCFNLVVIFRLFIFMSVLLVGNDWLSFW